MTRGCGKSLQYKRHYETHWSLKTKKVNELGVMFIIYYNIVIVLMMCEVTICNSAKNKNRSESLSLQDVLLWRKLFKLDFPQNVITKHFQTCSKKSKTTKYETTKNIKYFQIILTLIGSYCDEDESSFVMPRDSKETEQKQQHTRNKEVKYNLYMKQLKKSNYKKEKNNIECNSQESVM